jgi:hypothetical protein
MTFALLNLYWFLGTAAALFRSKAQRQRRGIRSVLATSSPSRIGRPLQHQQQQEPHGGSNGRRWSQEDRDLMFSSTTSPCSRGLLQSLQLSDPTTTTNTSMRITNCTETEIQWDEDGILTANLVRTVRAPTDLVSTTYKAYFNNGPDACRGFNACVVPSNGTEGFVVYPGQYEYDCSNVYCGPNAARECDGTYRDNPQCPADVTNEALLPDIPILRNVNCGSFSSWVETVEQFAELCGACQEDDQGLTTVTCESYCDGCNGNNTVCKTVQELLVFSEHQLTYVLCETITGGPVQCLTERSPADFNSFADPSLFSCELTLDGVACASCSVIDCGSGLNGLYRWFDVDYQADCTNVDQVSKVIGCDATGTGVFAQSYYDDVDPAMCPEGDDNETAVVPLIRAPPPIGTPITIVAQPPAPTAIAPVLPPTAAPPVAVVVAPPVPRLVVVWNVITGFFQGRIRDLYGRFLGVIAAAP